jgi:hypothetical protein
MTCFYRSLASKNRTVSLGQSDNLKNGRSGNYWHIDRPARDGNCRRPWDNPGKANTPTRAHLSQSEIRTPCLSTQDTGRRIRTGPTSTPRPTTTFHPCRRAREGRSRVGLSGSSPGDSEYFSRFGSSPSAGDTTRLASVRRRDRRGRLTETRAALPAGSVNVRGWSLFSRRLDVNRKWAKRGDYWRARCCSTSMMSCAA